MKKLILIVATLALTVQPVLAGSPAGAEVSQRKQKLTELKKEKNAAMASHALEAALMKELRRDGRTEQSATAAQDSRLANNE